MSLSSPQRHTPTKGRVIGGGMAGNYGSPHRSGRSVRFQANHQCLPSVAEDGSNGSASTSSFSTSGGSLSPLGPNNATSHPLTASRGQVDSQTLQAKQQLPATPQKARRMTVNGNMSSSLASASFSCPQSTQHHDEYAQKKTPVEINHLKDADAQRRISHASQTSDNWRSSGRPSFSSSSRRSSAMVNPVDTTPPSMTDIPEYLAVQEMAFRQGQYDSGNSRSRIPPSPFANHLDHIWEQYFKMGAAYGGAPTAPPVASSLSHDNFAWSVLINPGTQDLEHPNGSVDLEWARKMCIMALNCMKELIFVVRNRRNDWRKIVCDIPLPVKQAIVAFPDLCEYYEALQRDAYEAFHSGL